MIKQDLFKGENTRLLYDIMQITEDKNSPGMLMLCDFEKAFDSVSHDFILNTLKNICNWITTLYRDAFANIQVNVFCLTQLIFNAAVDKAIHYHHTFLFLVQKLYPLK